jgi:hypothetical protein
MDSDSDSREVVIENLKRPEIKEGCEAKGKVVIVSK